MEEGIGRTVPGSVRPAKELGPLLLALLLVVAVVVWGTQLVERTIRARPPFQPEALHLHLTSTVHTGYAQELLRKIGVSEEQLNAPLPRTPGEQFLVGQLNFTLPVETAEQGTLSVFVIDNRSHQLAQGVWGYSPGATCVTTGWGAAESSVIEHSWVGPAAGARTEAAASHLESDTMEIPAPTNGPLTFIAMFRPGMLPFTDPARDLTVAVGFVGKDDQLFWTQRLPIEGPPPQVSPLPPRPTEAQLLASSC
jgi:hypothetical protein